MKLLDLPEEVLVKIATQLPLPDFVHLQSTNKKLRECLSRVTVFRKLVEIRVGVATTPLSKNQCLEALSLFEQVKNAGLLDDNRIGFGEDCNIFIDDYDDDLDETDIKGSYARIDTTKELMRRNPQLILSLEAHSGTSVPEDEADGCSIYLGQVALDEFTEFMADSPEAESSRLGMKAWGKRVAEAASNSHHKYAATARKGKGWVEMRLGMIGNEDFELPIRPSFYDGLETLDIPDWMEEENEDEAEVDEDEEGNDDDVINIEDIEDEEAEIIVVNDDDDEDEIVVDD